MTYYNIMKCDKYVVEGTQRGCCSLTEERSNATEFHSESSARDYINEMSWNQSNVGILKITVYEKVERL